MEIHRIQTFKINNVNSFKIPNLYVPNWAIHQPTTDHLVPPVVFNIGVPIIDLPGCALMHKDNKKHKNGVPIDKDLVEDDPDGIMTVCDAGYPTYDAMNYEPEQLILIRETPPPPVSPPPDVEPPSIPDTDILPPDPKCPGPGQLRVGDTTQSGKEKVIGHQLVQDPANPARKICETLYEPTSNLEKYVPPLNQVSTVTALAVVATAGAAATPLLIRIVKPAIKKIWTTIQKKLGKTPTRLSRNDVMANNYRAKKGLPPFKVRKFR